jgi:hypothetical protein
MGDRTAALAVFAVFATIYQPSAFRTPRKCSAIDGSAI